MSNYYNLVLYNWFKINIKNYDLRGVIMDEYYGEDDKRDCCYLCAIVYPLILIGLSFMFYLSGDVNLLKLIIAIILAIATGVFILLGGFYFIIIPLPFIHIFKSGCSRLFLPIWKKILYGFLTGLSITLVFIVLFATGN